MAKTESAPGAASATSADGAADKAREAAEAAKETVGEVADAALDRTEGLRLEARSKAAELADGRKERIVEGARSVQSSIESTADALRDEQPQIADVFERAASGFDEAISWIETREVGELASELGAQVRQRPLLFAAAMFGVGFALTRVARPVGHGGQAQRPAGGQTASPRLSNRGRFVQQGSSQRVPTSQTLAGV